MTKKRKNVCLVQTRISKEDKRWIEKFYQEQNFDSEASFIRYIIRSYITVQGTTSTSDAE